MKSLKIIIISSLVFISPLFSEVWEGYVNITKDYIVDGVLEIMPGTVVRVASGKRIIIDSGYLKAQGTESDMIRFTSFEPESSGNDNWAGIEFLNAAAEKDTSLIDYCIIENIIKDPQEGKGSIYIYNSVLEITNSTIRNNSAAFAGAVQTSDSYLYMHNNRITDNTNYIQGGAIYISHSTENKYAETVLVKNLIKDNSTINVENPEFSGGGIVIQEKEREPANSYTLLQENDIVANTCGGEKLSGYGGGINIQTGQYYRVDVIGNKIMYNRAEYGGGLNVKLISKETISLHNFTNNIISNNSSLVGGAGASFDMGTVKLAEDDLTFHNNNIINNNNETGEYGSGGFFIEFSADLNNFFPVKNSIIWNNMMRGTLDDIGSYPQLSPDTFVSYSNTTIQIKEGNNISEPSLFFREVDYYGALPYENYLRGDYHLSLESPCVDAGDPKMESVEPDGTPVNIGAYGNTNEATTSIYETIIYKDPLNIYVKQGETFMLDCRDASKEIRITDLSVEDGGQIFIAPSTNSRDIFIDKLTTAGKKIGDTYTTRIQRMTTAEGSEFSSNILNIQDMNCIGAEFNNMAINLSSANPSSLEDSHVYVYDYDPALVGINISSPEAYVNNNIIDNFGTGIYYQGGKEKNNIDKLSKSRLTNNSISFEPTPSTKTTEKKGIVVSNAEADISGNTIINPNEGVEAAASSGRMTNNSISFEPTASSKAGALKKAIAIYNSSDYEIDHNSVTCEDAESTSIAALYASDSYINAHYNTISFSSYLSDRQRYGFQAQKISEGSIFINNTVYNSNYGVSNTSSIYNLDLINNIFYGPGHLSLITSDQKNLKLYNNNVVGTIDEKAIVHEEGTTAEDPIFHSSRVSDYYLWETSACINTGYYDPAYHSYGTTYYGTAPDRGSVEFYERSQFYAPANLSMSADASSVTLSWTGVPDATSYKIYRSENPYTGFKHIDSTSSNSWTGSTSGASKLFYYVSAVRNDKGSAHYTDSGYERKYKPQKKNKNIRINNSRSLK